MIMFGVLSDLKELFLCYQSTVLIPNLASNWRLTFVLKILPFKNLCYWPKKKKRNNTLNVHVIFNIVSV